MTKLYNKISNQLLKKKKNILRFNISFYKYCVIKSPKELRNLMYIIFYKLNIFGRIYISYEGINAQLSVCIYNFYKMKKIIYSFFKKSKNIIINKSINTNNSFWVLKIKIRKKILSDGLKNFFLKKKYYISYLKIIDVNNILKKNIIIIDLRNSYEYKIGHFYKSFFVPALTFREQLKKIIYIFKYAKNYPILIYCTGGIRCEKAGLWMQYHGYKYIYQIKGGIIKYIRDAKKYKLPIYFYGNNFVFDNRLLEKITNDKKSYCWQCYDICNTYINCKNNYCHKLFIQCVNCYKKFFGYCSLNCMNNKFLIK